MSAADQRRDVTGRPPASLVVSAVSAPAWDATIRPTVRPRDELPLTGNIIRKLILTAVFVAFAATVAVGALWVRLLHGAIPLDFAASTLAAAIATELGDQTVKVDGLDLELDDSRAIRLSLRQVQISDMDGAVVASAPRARLTISGSALRRGALAPELIELVSPRMQVTVADDGHVTLGPWSGQNGARDTASTAPVTPPPPSNLTAALVRTVTGVSERARRRANAGGYLRRVALTQAVIVVATARRRTIWNVPELFLDLEHRRARSDMAARATIASLTGPWTLAVTTREASDTGRLEIDVQVEGLNPRGLARIIPVLAPLERLDVPLEGTAAFVLSGDGRVLRADVNLAGDGALQAFSDRGGLASLVDRAALVTQYDGDSGRVTISKLMLGVGGGEITLQGSVAPPVGGDTAWIYMLALAEGRLPPPTVGATAPRIDHLVVQGRIDPVAGQLLLSNLALKSGGAEVAASGTILRTLTGPQGAVDGRIGAMSARQFVTLWPESLAPQARAWVAAHLLKGTVAGGSFKLALEPGTTIDVAPRARSALTLETSGLELKVLEGLPPLELPRALVRFDGGDLDVSAPEAAMAGADGRKLSFRVGRLLAPQAAPGEQPTADLSFRVSGALATALDLADRPSLQTLRGRGVVLTGVDGRLEGPVRLQFPLAGNVQASEIRPDAKVRITDLRGRQLPGGLELSGGTVTIDADDRALDLKGDLLFKSVAAKLNWQYVFNSPPAQQAPVRLTAVLDNADRTSLGLDVADLMQGETPVEITISAAEAGTAQARVRVDLTKAELTFEPIAFRKAPGRPAVLQFEPSRGPGGAAAPRLELQNLRLAGDDVALEGWIALGPDNRPREFSLPVFSVNVVSRLEVHGKLRPDRVWDIRAKGPTFDGRPMFRALFDLGRPPGVAAKPGERTGVDLTAEIDTVLGFSDTTLRAVKVTSSRRDDRMTTLDFKGTLEGGKPFAALIRNQPNGDRQLLAEGGDAGQVFKLVGFYGSAVGGLMQLEVNLDGKGVNERSGTLWARDFAVLGDPVASEVFQNADPSSTPSTETSGRGGRPKVLRSRFDFDGMRIPFNVGQGQFVMNDAVLRGPLVGATMRGRIDFRNQTVNVGGTYVPASALNSALGGILGPLSGGPQGEGLFGITFAVQGPIAKPQVIVNPLSLLTPGIFREIMQMTPDTFAIQPRDGTANRGRGPSRGSQGTASPPTRASSSSATDPKAPAAPAPGVTPEVSSDWQGAVKREPRQP